MLNFLSQDSSSKTALLKVGNSIRSEKAGHRGAHNLQESLLTEYRLSTFVYSAGSGNSFFDPDDTLFEILL